MTLRQIVVLLGRRHVAYAACMEAGIATDFPIHAGVKMITTRGSGATAIDISRWHTLRNCGLIIELNRAWILHNREMGCPRKASVGYPDQHDERGAAK